VIHYLVWSDMVWVLFWCGCGVNFRQLTWNERVAEKDVSALFSMWIFLYNLKKNCSLIHWKSSAFVMSRFVNKWWKITDSRVSILVLLEIKHCIRSKMGLNRVVIRSPNYCIVISLFLWLVTFCISLLFFHCTRVNVI